MLEMLLNVKVSIHRILRTDLTVLIGVIQNCVTNINFNFLKKKVSVSANNNTIF